MDCDTWPVPEAGCFGGCTIPDDVDPDLLEAKSAEAGTILRTLSGNRVGLCADTVRPIGECGCRNRCVCGSGDRIRLYSPYGPVTGVGEVNIDGTVLDPAEYRFYPSGQTLYRRPPEVWPYLDSKWAACGEPDTMCVQVLIGSTPDAWALSVHAELTCELLKACTGQACRLPSKASTVTGQGVTITLSPEEIASFIPAVSRWVTAINPGKATQPTKVWSPDTGPKGVQGSGEPGGEVGPFPPWDIDGGWA